MDLKEKLICALKSNAGDISRNYASPHYSFKGIILRCNYDIREVTTEVERKISKKYFWQSDRVVVEHVSAFQAFDHFYKIDYGIQSVEITKEEYDEILNLRKEKIEERELKKLDKLCYV